MKALTWYYVSRAVIAAAASAVVWSTSHSIWLTVATWLVTIAGFAWYVHSGHFIVDPSQPLTPVRRDEREQAITYRAATYAFVAVMLLLGLLLTLDLSIQWTRFIPLVGFAIYFAVRAWLRHAI